MGVLSISYHGCIRVVKEGLSLMNAGVPVDFLAARIANQDMQLQLPFISFYETADQFKVKLQMITGVDLYHVHNEPDWIVYKAKAARPEIPLVYDCHDLQSMRSGEATKDEVRAMKAADAYIFPSAAYMEGAVRYHGLPDSKPRDVIYSMCTEAMIVEEQLPRIGGIAYEGGLLAIKDDAPAERKKALAYRDYRPIARGLTALDIPFVVYGANNLFIYEYLKAGAVYISMLPYHILLKELTRHDWGLVGCPVSHPQWEMAMPNKLFEYIAAGIPVIVLHAAECAKFVEKHGIGVVVDRVEDIPKVYEEHEKYRKRVREIRHDFTMESQVPKIKAIYRGLMGR